MNAWKHSLSSQRTFGGDPEDYLPIHRFLDSSKLFCYHLKHRAMLHHLLGIEYCEEMFGTVIDNSASKKIPVREIAAQHIREDLNQVLPSVNDWFQNCAPDITAQFRLPEIPDRGLEEFILRPWLRSGLKASLAITFSHFGVYLAQQLSGWETAKQLAELVPAANNPKTLLKKLQIRHRWQYTPDRQAIEQLNNGIIEQRRD